MASKITSKQKSRFNDADAKKIKNFLQKMFPDGLVDARQVLELAKPKNSPIHHYFNWNDSEAAERYRIMQAQQLIRCVVVEVDGKETRKYVSPVVVNAEGDKRYVEIEKARHTPDIWEQVLVRAFQEASAWKARYNNLKELSLVHVAIEKTERELKKQGVSI